MYSIFFLIRKCPCCAADKQEIDSLLLPLFNKYKMFLWGFISSELHEASLKYEDTQ